MRVYVYFNTQRIVDGTDIPIYLSISFKSHTFRIFTGLYSTVKFDGAVFPRTERNFKHKTIRLNKMIEQTEQILLDNYNMPFDELRAKVRREVFAKSSETKKLHEYLTDFAAKKDERSTIEKYTGTAKKVKDYDPEATLAVNFLWLEEFEEHLRKTLAVNSVAIHLRNIRSVFNWALKNGWTNNYPFRQFSIKKEQTRKRNLSAETLAKIRDADMDEEHRVYRDIFMLMFYLIGINIKDLCLAERKQIVDGRLEYRRAKTKKMYSIKLEPEAVDILNRYKGKEKLLSVCENTDYRNIARLVNEYVGRLLPGTTSYYTRHSWATIAYGIGIPKDIISQALGHAMGAEMTEIYIERDERVVDEANRKVLDYLKDIKND